MRRITQLTDRRSDQSEVSRPTAESGSAGTIETPFSDAPFIVDRAAWLALATGSLAFVVGTVNVTVTNVGFSDILDSFPGAQLFMRETAVADRTRRLDLLGVAMGSGSVFLVVYATLRGPSAGWSSPVVIAASAASGVLVPLFLVRSARHPEPLFDPRMFRIRSFAVANIAVSFSMVGAFTSWVLWPIYLINVWHYSVWGVGLAFLVSPVISGLVAILGGRWADTHGFPAIMAIAAGVASLGHLWALLFLGSDVRFWFSFFPITVLFGLGMGILASMLNAAALRDIESKAIATANGVHQSLRYAVGGMGTALALAVLNGHHDIWRYKTMWLILGAAQLLVVPLMALAYPEQATVEERRS